MAQMSPANTPVTPDIAAALAAAVALGNPGPTGPAGATGAAGLPGSTGAAGPTGSTGPAGATGPTGSAGAAGSAGATGATGATGPAGVVAATAPVTYNSGTQTVGVTVGTTTGTVAAGDDSRITGAATAASVTSEATTARAAESTNATAITTEATTARNASNLSSGTVADARLPSTAQAATLTATYVPLAGGTMTGAIAMGSHKVTGLTNGSAAQDAAALGQVALLTGVTYAGYEAPAVVFLVDGASIPVNAAFGNDFRVTLGGNRTLANPTNPVNGQRILFQIIQDGTGSRTLAYGTAYKFSATLPQPVLTTTLAATDILGFVYSAAQSKWLFISFLAGF